MSIYKLGCGKSENHNCAICYYYNGEGSGLIICKENRGKYKFSFINWIKAVLK